MSEPLATPPLSEAVVTPTTLADAAPSLAEQLYSTPPVTPVDATAPVVDAKPTEITEEGPEYVQAEDGRWRRADGTFATTDELAQIEAQLSEADKAKADADANRAATVAKLRDRNGNVIEVETGDEQLAQLINQNTNDGMRRREFLEAKSSVEAREAIITRAESIIEHNPEGFVEQNLTPDQQVRLATMLLARHFDALIPIIQGYDANPSSRIAATAEAQLLIKQQTDDFRVHGAAQSAAAAVRQAVAALIPESAEQDIADQFWADASADVQRALSSGQQIDPANVANILAPRLKLYGFSAAGTAPAAKTMPRITLAKPGQPKPAELAAPSVSSQQRLRLVQQQRRNAAAIPPQGRGGPAKPATSPTDRAFQDAANLLYGGTTRAS